jgi:hypothetical protein
MGGASPLLLPLPWKRMLVDSDHSMSHIEPCFSLLKVLDLFSSISPSDTKQKIELIRPFLEELY